MIVVLMMGNGRQGCLILIMIFINRVRVSFRMFYYLSDHYMVINPWAKSIYMEKAEMQFSIICEKHRVSHNMLLS